MHDDVGNDCRDVHRNHLMGYRAMQGGFILRGGMVTGAE